LIVWRRRRIAGPGVVGKSDGRNAKRHSDLRGVSRDVERELHAVCTLIADGPSAEIRREAGASRIHPHDLLAKRLNRRVNQMYVEPLSTVAHVDAADVAQLGEPIAKSSPDASHVFPEIADCRVAVQGERREANPKAVTLSPFDHPLDIAGFRPLPRKNRIPGKPSDDTADK
jgi:hypothetical protein